MVYFGSQKQKGTPPMKGLLIALVVVGLAGCSSAPRKPASLDGAPRVPVNKTAPNAPAPVSNSSVQGDK